MPRPEKDLSIPLDQTVMEALGFSMAKPMGNTNSVWWGHDVFSITFYDGCPSATQLIQKLMEKGHEEGVRSTRAEMRKALGL